MKTLNATMTALRNNKLGTLRAAMAQLDGKAEGGWGETAQAREAIASALPARQLRNFGLGEFIAAAFVVDARDNAAGVYRLAI